jgi:uncharacterized membrane protein YedE/YeeE
MLHLLPTQLPWFLVGPGIGLLIAGLYAVANRPLGASGAYVQTMDLVRTGSADEPWRAWYFVGILGGAILVSLLRGSSALGTQYGALGRWLPLIVLVPVLFAAGTMMGYGARWMGGCTSGHGLCGTSTLSISSIAATVTFFATAVGATFVLHVVSGGAL